MDFNPNILPSIPINKLKEIINTIISRCISFPEANGIKGNTMSILLYPNLKEVNIRIVDIKPPKKKST